MTGVLESDALEGGVQMANAADGRGGDAARARHHMSEMVNLLEQMQHSMAMNMAMYIAE